MTHTQSPHQRRGSWGLRVGFLLLLAGLLPMAGGPRWAQAQGPQSGGQDASTTAVPERPPFELSTALRLFDQLYRASSTQARVELAITTPRASRTLTLDLWTQGDDKALIVINAPPREAGVSTLRVEDNIWNYLPQTPRTIRIPPAMMLSPWMGSDFTNDDLVQKSSLEKDFLATLVGRSTEPAGWIIALEARPDLVGVWKRIGMVVSEDGTLPRVLRYYDRKDRLARTMSFHDVKTFGDRAVPTRILLKPEEEGKQTELKYLDLHFDVEVPDSRFTLAELEKTR